MGFGGNIIIWRRFLQSTCLMGWDCPGKQCNSRRVPVEEPIRVSLWNSRLTEGGAAGGGDCVCWTCVLGEKLCPSYGAKGGEEQTICIVSGKMEKGLSIFTETLQRTWMSRLCKTGQPESVSSCDVSGGTLSWGTLEAYDFCQKLSLEGCCLILEREVRQILCWVDKCKCAHLQKIPEFSLEKLQASQPYFSPCESHGVSPFGICCWANWWLKQSEWIS